MTNVSTSQLTLSFEPALPERWATLREYIAHRVGAQAKPAKTIAADMDLSPSTLSRKLNPGEGDSQRFNVDDLEAYLRSSGDVASVIEYLAAKFMQGGDDARRARALSRVELLATELEKAIREVKA
jgi:hypothetical protein